MKSGGCYAIGGLFSKERITGTPLIVGLIGKIVESPIFLDYLKETHQFPGPAAAVMAITLILDIDFVDTSLSKKPYLETLVHWHPELPGDEIKAMNPTRPDILTRNGLRFGQGNIVSRDRNEYYEIKPDSPSGDNDGDNDLANIKQFFKDLRKKYKLKTAYVPGDTYPSNPLKEKRLPLPLNRDFVNLASVLLRRYALTKLECYLLVRRSKPGLLQYKICFEFESDDKRRQVVLARAISKILAAAYVVTTVPWRFPQAESELGDHTLEGDPLPRIHCQFDVIPDLIPLTKSIEDLIFMRGIGYPGDEFLLFCDEGYYWSLLAQRPIGTTALWQGIKAAFKGWIDYAPGHPVWASFQPWVDKAEEIGGEIKRKYPYLVEFADALIEYGRRHPLELLAIVVLPIILTAGVVLALEAGLIGGALLVAEGGLSEASAPVVAGLGRTAMTSEAATQILGAEAALATQPLQTAAQVAQQVGGLGVAANEGAAVARVIAGPGLKTAIKVVGGLGVAAAYLLCITARTAYAQSRPNTGDPQVSPGVNSPSPPNAVDGKVVAETIDRLLAARPLPAPRNTLAPLIKGRSFNVHNYAPTSPLDTVLQDGKPLELDKNLGPPPPLDMRYLGRVKIT